MELEVEVVQMEVVQLDLLVVSGQQLMEVVEVDLDDLWISQEWHEPRVCPQASFQTMKSTLTAIGVFPAARPRLTLGDNMACKGELMTV